MELKRFRVLCHVYLTNGRSETYVTFVEALGTNDAKSKATAEIYHAYGANNIKNISYSASPATLTVRTYNVTGNVYFTNGKSERFSTVAEGYSPSDAKAKAVARIYHDFGIENVRSFGLSAAPVR